MLISVFFILPCILKFKVIVSITCCPRTPRSAGGAPVATLPLSGQWAGPLGRCGTDDWLAGLFVTASRPRPTSHDAAHHGGRSAAALARSSAGLLPLLLLRGGGGGGTDGRAGRMVFLWPGRRVRTRSRAEVWPKRRVLRSSWRGCR